MISDWDCLERARRGDEDAWRLLFQRYHRVLIKLTLLITGSPEAAGDLAQETFIRLLNSQPKHRDGIFKTYLTTIAYRLALKEKRRRERNRNLHDYELADESPSPLEETVRDEQSKHIARAILTLPDHHRDILVLRFYGDHSYEEIAHITKLPLGTVKSRLFYAVKSCQEVLGKRGVL